MPTTFCENGLPEMCFTKTSVSFILFEFCWTSLTILLMLDVVSIIQNNSFLNYFNVCIIHVL